jgi:HD-GYP domain-containing protein (c-di-GMP phosphodiesterase class II)
MRKRREAYTALRSTYNCGIVAAFVEVVEQKDSHTAMHMRAVAGIAALIGLEMGLPAQELGIVFVGGLLHDVGKIGVPDAPLRS